MPSSDLCRYTRAYKTCTHTHKIFFEDLIQIASIYHKTQEFKKCNLSLLLVAGWCKGHHSPGSEHLHHTDRTLCPLSAVRALPIPTPAPYSVSRKPSYSLSYLGTSCKWSYAPCVPLSLAPFTWLSVSEVYPCCRIDEYFVPFDSAFHCI